MTGEQFLETIRPCLESFWPYAWKSPGDDLVELWARSLKPYRAESVRGVLHSIKSAQSKNQCPNLSEIRRLLQGPSERKPTARTSWVSTQRHAFERDHEEGYRGDMSDEEVAGLAMKIMSEQYPMKMVRGAPMPIGPRKDEAAKPSTDIPF